MSSSSTAAAGRTATRSSGSTCTASSAGRSPRKASASRSRTTAWPRRPRGSIRPATSPGRSPGYTATSASIGGRSDALFVAGHSAGGHLVSLIAADEQYLREEELEAQGHPRRDLRQRRVRRPAGAVPLRARLRQGLRRTADRLAHHARARPACPRSCCLHGESELPYCDASCVERFHDTLQEAQVDCKVCPITKRDHYLDHRQASARRTTRSSRRSWTSSPATGRERSASAGSPRRRPGPSTSATPAPT